MVGVLPPSLFFLRRHAAQVQMPLHAGHNQLSLCFFPLVRGGCSPRNLNKQRSQYFFRQIGRFFPCCIASIFRHQFSSSCDRRLLHWWQLDPRFGEFVIDRLSSDFSECVSVLRDAKLTLFSMARKRFNGGENSRFASVEAASVALSSSPLVPETSTEEHVSFLVTSSELAACSKISFLGFCFLIRLSSSCFSCLRESSLFSKPSPSVMDRSRAASSAEEVC
mmetsp:Transcript_1756/g.2186  ORF Transcript_1756/g.2186 Transcript_1756/m.2186 type:complete len:222 (-) Transcript_1756:35-700(-)